MSESRPDVLQGTLDLMVLKTLDVAGPLHGFGLARRIEDLSDQLLRLNEGTVYVAVVRLSHRGLVTARWGISEDGRRARFYSLTTLGRQQLAREALNWDRIAVFMGRMLKLRRAEPV